MNLHRTGLLLVVLGAMTTSSTENVEFTLSSEVTNEGQTLTAVCSTTTPSVLIIWVKKTVDDNYHLVELGTNQHINDDFRRTGRYSAETRLDGQAQFILTVSDLRSEDSGWIGCKPASEEQCDNLKLFTVQVPIQKIWWTSNGQIIHSQVSLREAEIQKFSCHVNGSYPNATVQVLLGDEDITDRFDVMNSLIKGHGVKGLQPLYYKTEVVSRSTIIGYRNMTKVLKCVAKLSNSDTPAQANIHVNVTEYSPVFLCEKRMLARLHEPYFNLTCKVRARPSVKEVKFHWVSIGGNRNEINETLEAGEKSHDMSTNVTRGETNDEIVMVMTIYRVSRKHFLREYVFEAENDVNRVRYVVHLQQDKSPMFTSYSGSCSSHAMKMAMQLLLLLTVMVCHPSA